MNVLDSELVLGQLRAQGYEIVEEPDGADVVLYNTCSVRQHAEQKVWSRLGELLPVKALRPDMVIGVIGCMAERDGTRMLERFPHVDVLCGPGELDKLPGLIHNAVVTSPGAADRQQVALMGAAVRRSSTLEAAEDQLESLDLSRSISPADDVTQAYVRITRGCNKFCTYCVVPYTRGPEVHRPPQNIIDEVKMLADAGVVEVTLLGQTINHYAFAHGDGRKTTFAELLYQIHEAVPHLPRLRFVTSYPRDFTNEALDAMRDCSRICRYLHAPAQHGSDRILKMMNRGYTVAAYRDFLSRARERMPDVSVASDFIVGFPTETEEEFEGTLDLVRECRFKNSFIFKYSPRPGTIAIDRFADDISEAVKRRRNSRMLEVQGAVSAALNVEMVGQQVELLVEGESKLVSRRAKPATTAAYPASDAGVDESSVASKGRFSLPLLGKREQGKPQSTTAVAERPSDGITQMVGRTRGDQVVVFDGKLGMKGKLFQGKIVRASAMTLFAELLA